MNPPLLRVENIAKQYVRGLLRPQVTFDLNADFEVARPAVVGVLGPNGSGKTTLFELMTGSNLPSAGRVLVNGQDIHRVRTRERDRLAIHYHQSYQLRSFQRNRPNFMLDHAASDSPLVHLFDEPQFNTQDGYIGFMLDFFRSLKSRGRLVFLCLHPNEPYHIDILRQSCERFIFVQKGRVTQLPDFDALMGDERVRAYLGAAAAPQGRGTLELKQTATTRNG
ncbi:ATP-binding cassette domain-containing protein [Variovorax saccharolyticus]|uniref:ATP-binding cassette domain-containing protein n=1 Tax=Variovorax saccharolyticus TaxID=3053516 RepID=UPI0025762643|nr:ATP-binding cassette domain-containing protein [Variovorax sp. J31P216]MDM0023802.1 ATP-binding cassette domain-containing protein [Variovorax sp. J31P216]